MSDEEAPPLDPRNPFVVELCDCGAVLFDGRWNGIIRLRCRGCGKRVWVGRKGEERRLLAKDTPNRRILPPGPKSEPRA